jgi:predicted alpha/beta-hydrolase family hydrolase
VLLAPGAGADRNHPTLVALEGALADVVGPVARMDFPYRRAGRRAPDRLAVLTAALRAEADALAAHCDAVVLGGRSMGGRIASMVAAEGFPAAGLILVSYPLHPPGRPDRPRRDHFPDLRCPCLFVSGTRDPFATPAELEEATRDIPGPVTHRWVDGGDHSLRGADYQVCEAAVCFLGGTGGPGG